MTARGTKAIADTTPVNSVGGLSVALGEFYKEGLPHLIGAALMKEKIRHIPKAGSEEYLNWQFGYKPLASDIAKVLASIIDVHSIVGQYLRDSGRNVRRARRYPEEVTTSSVTIPRCQLAFVGMSTGSNGSERYFQGISSERTGVQFTKTVKQYSFSGAYTYHVPGMDNLLDMISHYASLSEKVTGLGISPETLWNLQPWTWLADWAFNFGNIIHNLSAFSQDSLVLRYGYMMCTTSVERTITHPGAILANGTPTGPVAITFRTVRKERVKSTPYGFGLNPSSFTTRQWSILGALGMTRSPNSLK
jgi:hypothetical protein